MNAEDFLNSLKPVRTMINIGHTACTIGISISRTTRERVNETEDARIFGQVSQQSKPRCSLTRNQVRRVPDSRIQGMIT